jgi:hypothetical protein
MQSNISIYKLFCCHNIPFNEISNESMISYFYFTNVATNVDWCKNELILIYFIDKLVEVNYTFYEKTIIVLHKILIILLKELFERNQIRCCYEYQHAKDYILYLLNNKDYSKLKRSSVLYSRSIGNSITLYYYIFTII